MKRCALLCLQHVTHHQDAMMEVPSPALLFAVKLEVEHLQSHESWLALTLQGVRACQHLARQQAMQAAELASNGMRGDPLSAGTGSRRQLMQK